MKFAQLYKKQWLMIHLPIWIVATVLFLLLGHFSMPMPTRYIMMSTGPTGGMYQEYGAKYIQALKAYGIELEVKESVGTGENLQRLSDPNSGIQAAFVQGGYIQDDTNKQKSVNLQTVAQIDIEPLILLSRIKDLDSLEKLRGLKVAIGPAGSGSRAVALRMFEEVRLRPEDFIALDTPFQASASALKAGTIDAMLVVAPASAPFIKSLLQTPGIQLASLRRSAALIERMPYLEARFIGAGTLNQTTNQPPRDIYMLATVASMVVREDLHPMIKRVLAASALKIHSAAGPLHAAGEFPHLKRLEYPSSSHSRDVLRNGLPWLEEHLGVYWAQWVYRLLLIGLPLAFIAYILGRILPAYLSWLMESKINRWYGELKYIENDLKASKPGGLELARFRGQLIDIEGQVRKFQAPRSFHQRLYVLQQHIKFVNTQLQGSYGR